MARKEGVIVCLSRKQRFHTLDLKLHLDAGGELIDHVIEGNGHVLLCVHRRADCGEQMRVIRSDDVVLIEVQRPDKCFSQLWKEVERTSEEGNGSADRFSAGETADCLVDNCLEDRGGEVFSRRALVDQRLNIRFCEYATAGSDRVDHLIILGIVV